MKRIYPLIALALILTTCKKDEKSSEAKILSMAITESSTSAFTSGPVVIDSRLNLAFAFINRKLENNDFPISITPEFTLSEGARISPESGQAVSFSEEESLVFYVVTAEDGTTGEWYVGVRGNQLPNSDFEDWYETSGLNSQAYMDPGKSEETSIWSTANKGTSIYSLYGTEPLKIGNNTFVQITTGETAQVPVAAGTIFTGRFDIQLAISNPDNPNEATDFGTPFPFRPSMVKFDYSYKAGPRYIQGILIDPNNIFGGFTVTQLPGSDQFRLYVIMDIMEGETRTEIGRAQLEDGNSDVISEVILPIVYTSDQNPTHITVMFTSSKDGSLFTGAVGSTLIVDDLELIYD
jgi:hypothetical protein